MRIVLAVLISLTLYLLGIPLNFIYPFIALGFILSGICLYPLLLLNSNLKDMNGVFVERLYVRWISDDKQKGLIAEIIALVLLQCLNFVFIGIPLLVTLLCVGLLFTVGELILHIRKYYLEDFQKLLEIINKE